MGPLILGLTRYETSRRGLNRFNKNTDIRTVDKTVNPFLRFEVFMAETMNNVVFWDVTLWLL
jgi:hypothetical protein